MFKLNATNIIFYLLLLALPGCIGPCAVWCQEYRGKADLAEATYNRQITVEEAKAELEAATMKARTDSIRAIGTANANRIIAESITDEYLRWMWIEKVSASEGERIYIPTEAGIPILEAKDQN